MNCTNKQQETCDVEKLGCDGCYYNNKTRRKIIEIYVTENEEEDSISFEFERCEDSEIANDTMKGLCMMVASWKDKEDELEIIEYKDKDINIQDIGILPEFRDYDNYSIKTNREKINKLIQAVKQLDRNIKDKE